MKFHPHVRGQKWADNDHSGRYALTAAKGRKRLASVQSAGHLLTKHLALRFCVRAARSPGARPWPLAAYGDLGRRPTLPNPHGAFSPRKGGIAHPFHPHSEMGTRRAPPCTPWQLIQLGPERGLPLSGHSKAGTTRRLSLRPVRRLRRLIRDRHNKHFRPKPAIGRDDLCRNPRRDFCNKAPHRE